LAPTSASVSGALRRTKHAHFNWLARFVAIDNPIFTSLTRESLDGTPRNPASHGHEGKRIPFVMHSRLDRVRDFWCCYLRELDSGEFCIPEKLKMAEF
jgi:hypothetical protein